MFNADKHFNYLILIPCFVVLFFVSVLPIGYLLILSLKRINMVSFRSGGTWAGLENYARLLFSSPQFWPAFWRTIQYVGVTLALQFLIGMGLALIMNKDFPGRNFINNILLIPVMTTPIVIATLWKYLLNLNNGGINILLNQFLGLEAVPWLTNRPIPIFYNLLGERLCLLFNLNYAFLSIVLVNVWQWTPFVFLLLYAGIRTLPHEPFEAAQIDGAGPVQTFRAITLPLLRPVISVVLLLRLVDLIKVFDQIWALFGNAPFARTLNIELYTLGLMNQNYGMGAALSVMVLILSLALAAIFIKSTKTD